MDWLRITPGDAGFYLELHDLATIRKDFQKLGIWETVRLLAEQNSESPTTRPWHEQSEENLGMAPDTVISNILGRRCAMIAKDFQSIPTGVIISELPNPQAVNALLRTWDAQRLPGEGEVALYRLRAGISLAAWRQQIIFGPVQDSDGLWRQTVDLLGAFIEGRPGSHLRGRAEFAALAARIDAHQTNLLYAEWPDADDSDAPFQRLIAGLQFSVTVIECQIRAERSPREEALEKIDMSFLRDLPADTLAAWSGAFDLKRIRERLADGGENSANSLGSILETVIASLGGYSSEGPQRQLGPGVTIVVGQNNDRDTSSVVPPITAIIDAERPDFNARAMESAVDLLSRLIFALSGRHAEPGGHSTIVKSVHRDVEVRQIQIGPILARKSGLAFLESIEFCWAGTDGSLLLSSSLQHLERLIETLQRDRERNHAEAKNNPTTDSNKSAAIVEWSFVRGFKVADLFDRWVTYIQATNPAALEDRWWQHWARQRMESSQKLGLALKNDPERSHAAIVVEVDLHSPARGKIFPGDIILEVNGKALRTDQPAREVASLYASRDRRPSFVFKVLREGRERLVHVPLSAQARVSDFSPIRAIRNLTILLRRIDTVTVARHARPPSKFDADIKVRWRETSTAETR